MTTLLDDATLAPAPAVWQYGRLNGKVALVTGAAGNLGSVIVRRLLGEGATVVFTGRDASRVRAAMDSAVSETGVPAAHASFVVMDAGQPAQVRAALEDVITRLGRIDILINNAGSAGPRQTIENMPLTPAELAALREAGAADSETVGDAVHNILGVAWNLVRIAAPHLRAGASVINVSSIFSRTEYFGRTAYVVPKAALNALTRALADELGPRGIRVNNLVPGPIASDRIRSVFATMDKLRGDAPGSMAQRSFGRMSLARSVNGGPLEKTFPTPADIAAACVFLGSDDSAAFNGADFEVTHGMKVATESRSTWMNRPTMRSVDAAGGRILVAAGDQVEEGLRVAQTLLDCGAQVVLGYSTDTDAVVARNQAEPAKTAGRLAIVHLDRQDAAAMEAIMRDGVEGIANFTGAVVLPTHGPLHFQGRLSEANDAQVEHFVSGELTGLLGVIRTLARGWKDAPPDGRDPRVVFLTNRADS